MKKMEEIHLLHQFQRFAYNKNRCSQPNKCSYLAEAVSMQRNLQRYQGRVVEMIYMDRQSRITQRKVRIHSFREKTVVVYCMERRALRWFRLDGILAAVPVRESRIGS
jgi:hypothetical protein